MDYQDISSIVQGYKSFWTPEELDNQLLTLSGLHGFERKEIGHSLKDYPIYMFKAGDGRKRALVVGASHSNEQAGQLVCHCLMSYFAQNPEVLEASDYTWYFIPIIDPDGTDLNKGWFTNFNIPTYWNGFYRGRGKREIEWTFPIRYEFADNCFYVFDDPPPETQAWIEVMKDIEPDLMVNCHNYGLGPIRFMLSREFDKLFYDSTNTKCEEWGFPPLQAGSENPYAVKFPPPFYKISTVTDTVDFVRDTIKGDPRDYLTVGDNPAGYLLRYMEDKGKSPIVIMGDTPYFYAEAFTKKEQSGLTKREIEMCCLLRSQQYNSFYCKMASQILDKLSKTDPFYLGIEETKRRAERPLPDLSEYDDKEYDQPAKIAEVYNSAIVPEFDRGCFLGQLRRAAKKANLHQADETIGQKMSMLYNNLSIATYMRRFTEALSSPQTEENTIINRLRMEKDLEERISLCGGKMKEFAEITTLPIGLLVELQLLQIQETINYVERI